MRIEQELIVSLYIYMMKLIVVYFPLANEKGTPLQATKVGIQYCARIYLRWKLVRYVEFGGRIRKKNIKVTKK